MLSILSLGHILITDVVVGNPFMYSLPGMILLYWATPFYTKSVLHRIIYAGMEVYYIDTRLKLSKD